MSNTNHSLTLQFIGFPALAVAFGGMGGTSSDTENGESFSGEDGDNVANFVL